MSELKAGDQVEIVAGEHAGQTGIIMEATPGAVVGMGQLLRVQLTGGERNGAVVPCFEADLRKLP